MCTVLLYAKDRNNNEDRECIEIAVYQMRQLLDPITVSIESSILFVLTTVHFHIILYTDQYSLPSTINLLLLR